MNNRWLIDNNHYVQILYTLTLIARGFLGHVQLWLYMYIFIHVCLYNAVFSELCLLAAIL